MKAKLYQWYIVEQRSYRYIMKELGCNTARRIKKLLLEHNIPIRYGGEAVKTQWINNQERKDKTAQRAKENFAPHWGQPLSEESKLKISKANGGVNNGMYGVTQEDHPCWLGGKKNWSKGRKLSDQRKADIYKELGAVCKKCGDTNKSNLTINHKVPYRITKDHSIGNLEILCKSCHFSQPVHLR